MRFSYKKIFLIFIAVLILILTLFLLFLSLQKTQIVQLPIPTISTKPTETPFTTYKNPTLTKSDKYIIYLIGDSMTHAFGPRGGLFSDFLTAESPGTFFEISNYAEANQSILLLPDRLNEEVQADHDLLFNPIMEGDPDPNLIIIESFGYNPLSHLEINEGLKMQEEVLTQIMTTLTNRYPNTVIMFFATIAPDKNTYGLSTTDSDATGRVQQAEERIEYITSHVDFAREHNIPLINVYEESLDETGDGDTLYINPDDNIHPSAEGLEFMARFMTKRIMEENIFP